MSFLRSTTQLTFTCSRSTIETLEKGVKYVQNELTIKTPEQCHWGRSGVFYSVSIVDFNYVYVSCKWNLQQTCKPAIIIRQLERQLFLILATNNHASFYFRRKKKMMKYEKVQKYYDHHGISFSNKNHFLLYPLDRKILISKFIYTFLEHYLAFLLF